MLECTLANWKHLGVTMMQRRPLLFLTALSALLVAAATARATPFSSPILASAELEKPYTEVEFMGQVFALEQLQGGHNGRASEQLLAGIPIEDVVAACLTHPPVYDPGTGRWRIPVTNNLIHFAAENSPFGSIAMRAQDGSVNGYLEILDPASFNTPSFPEEDLDFPVSSVFEFIAEVELFDLGLTLFSRNTVTVRADNLTTWPPPVGTVYYQNAFVEMIATSGGPTVATIYPDTTVVTELLAVPEASSRLLLLFAAGLARARVAWGSGDHRRAVSPASSG